MKLRCLLVLTILAWGVRPGAVVVAAESAPKAIVLSWDGAVPSMVDDLLRRGELPHLAELIAGGAFADSVLPAFPSKTASGFAALWTGTTPRVNGISGNHIPRTPPNDFTILENTTGLFSSALGAEPLWFSAARAGRRAVVVQATQGWPFDPYVAQGRFGPGLPERVTIFEGYAGIAAQDGVVNRHNAAPRAARGWRHMPPSDAAPREIAFRVGSSRFFGLFIDDPGDPTAGYDTLVVARRKDALRPEATLKPGLSSPPASDKWSGAVAVTTPKQPGAASRFRLFELSRDGSEFLLYFSRPARRLASRPELAGPLFEAAGPFIGNGANHLYRRGALGPTIPQGGDGTAERRYLETVRLSHREVAAATRWALSRLPWDLLFTYTTYPDEAEHLWRGYLEPGLAGYGPAVAERLRPFLEEVYRLCDELLGQVARLRPDHALIALLADHGMEGVNRAVAVNAALRRAGLLSLNAEGRVDLAKTRALYAPMNNGYILINSKTRREGIVDAAERPRVVAQITAALREIKDGDRRVIAEIIDAEQDGERLGIGGAAGGDLYLDPLPGYDLDGRFDAAESIAPREPYGTHGFNPLRPSMRTIMVLNGPGVAAGRRLRDVRLIDFAPTISALLQIPAPRDSSGRVLSEALAPRPP